MREAFEKWVTEFLEDDAPSTKEHLLSRNRESYIHPVIRAQWRSWQAATAAAIPPGMVLVPEVPTIQMRLAMSDAVIKGGDGNDIYFAAIQAAKENQNEQQP